MISSIHAAHVDTSAAQENTQTALSPPRFHFSPCLFYGNIYLCGYGSALLERFLHRITRCCLSNSLCLLVRTVTAVCVEDNMLVVHLKYNIGLERDRPNSWSRLASKARTMTFSGKLAASGEYNPQCALHHAQK